MRKVVSLFHTVPHPARLKSPVRLWVVILLVFIMSGLSSEVQAGSYELGIQLYEAGNYTSAAQYLRMAATEQPNNPNVRYYLADTYIKLSRFSEAQAEYRTVLAIAPESQAARFSKIAVANLQQYLDNPGNRQWSPVAGLGKTGNQTDLYNGAVTGDDYLDEVTSNGRVVRWALPTMPLKLYVERSPMGIRNFQPGFISQVQRAMDVWSNVLSHQLSYVLVNAPEQADIRVSWINTIDTQGHSEDGGTAYTAGITQPVIRGEQLQHMDVKIATFDIKGRAQSAELIYAVAIHELGHALGLLGHSSNPQDIMSAQNSGSSVSQRDSNTIRKLYQKVADVNNITADQRTTRPQHDDEILASIDKGITKLEAQAKKDDMALTWLNLGVEYYTKAKQLDKMNAFKPGKPEMDPKTWFNKALDATDQAIQREPKDPRAYHKRSLIDQELGNYPQALQDIQQAISFDRKEPEYYMLQAWYLAKLNRKAEARSSLDTYLLYRPGEAKSTDVQVILKELGQK